MRQVLLNCLNLIIGSQLATCLSGSGTDVEHVSHVRITSLHVSSHVARLGGLAATVKLLDRAIKQEQVSSKYV